MKGGYNAKINDLEKENNHLHKVVEKFKQTIGLFIKWICLQVLPVSLCKWVILHIRNE